MAKILLVEDDKSLREIYGVRLMAEGYEIVSAGDGEEALAMAIRERPDLIVSDVMMPKISGFDMLDILRSTTETKDVKVIMMTALSSEDQRARGESLGADRYLVKSQVGIEDVVRTVHEVIGDLPGQMATPAQPAVQQTAVPEIPTAPVQSMPAPQPIAQPVELPPAPVAAIPEPAVAAPVQEFTPAPVETPVSAPMPEVPTPVAPVLDTQAPQPMAVEPVPVELPPMPAMEMPANPQPAPIEAVPQFEAPAPVAAPVAPQPIAQPVELPPAPVPVAPVMEMPAPAHIPAMPEATLPQPTAPFSSPAPASLGERVIEPLVAPAPNTAQPTDIAAQMAQALGQQQPPQGQ